MYDRNLTSQPPNPKLRDANLDALKGFLIILVVVGHSGAASALPHALNSFLGSGILRMLGLLPPITYFHMALFFSVSAVHSGALPIGKLAHRLTFLIVPFVFWTCWPVAWYVIKAIAANPHLPLWPFFHANVSPWLMDQLTGLAWGNWKYTSILWFLPALASFTLLGAIEANGEKVARMPIGRPLVIFLTVIIWSCLWLRTGQLAQWHVDGVIPWGVDVAIYLLPLGMLHRWIYGHRIRVAKIPPTVLILGVLVGELLITVFEPEKTLSPYHYRVDFAQFSVPSTFFGTAGFFLLNSSLFMLALRVKPIQILAWLGRYTLPIYVMHMYFIDFDLIKVWGADWSNQYFLRPGSLEALSYLSRLFAAIAIPVLISATVGFIIPFTRPLGFLAPETLVAWRYRLLSGARRHFAKTPDQAT